MQPQKDMQYFANHKLNQQIASTKKATPFLKKAYIEWESKVEAMKIGYFERPVVILLLLQKLCKLCPTIDYVQLLLLLKITKGAAISSENALKIQVSSDEINFN